MSKEDVKKKIQKHLNSIIKIINDQEDVKTSQNLLVYAIDELEKNVQSKPSAQKQQEEEEEKKENNDISIITWNVNQLKQTENKHIQRIHQFIVDTNANIVCLQEVTDKEALIEIKSLLNKNYKGNEVWDCEFQETGQGYQQQEISACFYNTNKFKLKAVYYGKDNFEYTRKPQILYLEKEGKIFTVVNFHLKDASSGAQNKIRLENEIKNLKPLSDTLKEDQKGGNPFLTLLVGDFNRNLTIQKENYFDISSTIFGTPNESTMSSKSQSKSKQKRDQTYDQIIAILNNPKETTVQLKQIVFDDCSMKLMNGQYISDHLAVGYDIKFEDQKISS
ncbi:hypothetical protein ABPG74_006276 [Tetrahymena malaccensis]